MPFLLPQFSLLLVLPKIHPFSFGDDPSYLGDSATVQCSLIAGDMPVKFSWSLNGKNVEDIPGVTTGSFGKKISVLAIDSVQEHHSGNYTCIVKNAAGYASHSTELIVKGTLQKHHFAFTTANACL